MWRHGTAGIRQSTGILIGLQQDETALQGLMQIVPRTAMPDATRIKGFGMRLCRLSAIRIHRGSDLNLRRDTNPHPIKTG
jgi:hypothetical protein